MCQTFNPLAGKKSNLRQQFKINPILWEDRRPGNPAVVPDIRHLPLITHKHEVGQDGLEVHSKP